MSNGGEENTPGRLKSDDFDRAVSRMAVAQICESAGFDGFKKSALDSLSDVTIQYLCDLGKTASFYANLSAKESGICDDGDFERKTLLEKRPALIFKFKTGKKLLGESLDLSLSKKGGRRIGHWLGRDDERDDKKRRAEYILRQSMENPQELTQLSAAL
ncbi:hypothetical protein NC652_036672 [Populus alba x Populus x berolinensis]|nr:hypothetical protein NC652_036672 [Populus alba x Populus x berolinensis]